MQSVQILLPHDAVKPYICYYGFFTHEIDGWTKDYILPLPALREHTIQIFPDEVPTLFSTQREFSVARCNIFGMADRSFLNSHMPRKCRRLQISFTPTGLFHLTGIPAPSFTNSLVDAREVWGPAVNTLVEQLITSTDLRRQATLLDAFFLDLIQARKKIHHQPEIAGVATDIFSRPFPFDIRAMAQRCHKSTRQFERNFKEHVGLSAQRFNTLNRFIHANVMKHKQPQKSWEAIAFACGYYDLHHLAKDFTALGRSNITAFRGYDYQGDVVVAKQH